MPNQITKAQERAIKHYKGACLCLAGPGSGKTFVITKRVVHMVQELHIPSEHILVITFTKAAAIEMEERFQKLLPDEHAWFGTFHSFFYYILKNSYTSFPNHFISTEEKFQILHQIFGETLGQSAEIPYEDAERMLALYINNGLSMKYMSQCADINEEKLKEIYQRYHRALINNGFIDFDNLMLLTYQLLKENIDVRERWKKQFQYILVDECQDMNVLQYEIVKLLAGKEQNVFLVGDDDQAVYQFRGARVELLQRFVEEYEFVEQIHLDINFRSTEGIVKASQKLIAQNQKRFAKKVHANNGDSGGLVIKNFEFRHGMYEMVIEELQKADKDDLSSCAIIYRTNQELRRMAYKLRQSGILYNAKEERKSIFDENWYLDVEAYIRLGLGSINRQDVLRVANKPNRFIKREQLINIVKLPETLKAAVKPICNMRPYLAVKYIWNGIGYGRWLERELYSDKEKWNMICEQLDEIVQDTKHFSTLDAWLEHVEEDRFQQKSIQKRQRYEQSQGVNLITMHASKGLEFDTVYLLDVNKGKVPRGSKLSAEEIEEERRLFYVAMTRAKKKLHIYYVSGTKDHTLQPSVFLETIMR